jgi:hypothetical protein
MAERQISMLDFGIADSFDCSRCVWMRTYGECYPSATLGRQYFFESNATRGCSDYCTEYAHVTEVSGK